MACFCCRVKSMRDNVYVCWKSWHSAFQRPHAGPSALFTARFVISRVHTAKKKKKKKRKDRRTPVSCLLAFLPCLTRPSLNPSYKTVVKSEHDRIHAHGTSLAHARVHFTGLFYYSPIFFSSPCHPSLQIITILFFDQLGFGIFFSIWFAAMFGVIELEGGALTALPYFPVWILCCFGSYSLGTFSLLFSALI